MNHEFWYLSRAAGLTAYVLLTVSVALGIGIGTRLFDRLAPRASVFEAHRLATLVALVLTLFHVFILLADRYFSFTVWQLLIPFNSPYRPWQTAAGAASLYALVLIVGSFYVRRRIGFRAWRSLHYLTFVLFAGASLHGITAGTDAVQPWARAMFVIACATVLGLLLYRVQHRLPRVGAVRTLRFASGGIAVCVAGFLLFGVGLFSGRSTGADNEQAVASTEGGFRFLESFNDEVSGTYSRRRDASAAQLVVDGVTNGDLGVRLHLELVQTPVDQDGDEDDGSADSDDDAHWVSNVNVTRIYDLANNTLICDGALTGLSESVMRVRCGGLGPYDGVAMNIDLRLRSGANGRFLGDLVGSMTRT